jgi:hypothetical protein
MTLTLTLTYSGEKWRRKGILGPSIAIVDI